MKPSVLACACAFVVLCGPAEARNRTRNVVIFVADGLRPGSLNPTDAPTFVRLQKEGVFFANSHSLFPTVTTANASAIATGHQLGDTGDFANTIYAGVQIANSGTPFIEDDEVLAALDAQTGGNYLGETSLLALARTHGFSTAAVGKLGPTLIEDVGAGSGAPPAATIFIDDRTGSGKGVPLDPAIAAAMKSVLGDAALPPRSDKPKTQDDNGYSGDSRHPGTRVANVRQQRFLADAVTKVILPEFTKRGKPFVLVFWSRDPDATQHNQGDSLGELSPGINGPTSKAAVHNADDTLRQILAALESAPALAATTDLFVTSDHGFSTVSRRDVDAEGRSSASGSTKGQRADVRTGDLPPGFVAIDIAAHLALQLCDPDKRNVGSQGVTSFGPVAAEEHPLLGNGLVARDCSLIATPKQARVVVAANGGSDLIYVPDGDRATIADVAAFLAGQDYVDALFVDGAAGNVPGALSLRDINLVGRALLPRPSIVVALKTFSRDPKDPLRTQVDVSDTTLQQGQGTHGSFGRADVTNTMIAFGPDFKRGFVDRAPASNADIPQTLARILGLRMPTRGRLAGRVLDEALAGGPPTTPSTCGEIASPPTKAGARTALHFQTADGVRYLDAAKKVIGPIVWGEWIGDLPCGGRRHGSAAAKP